MKTRSAAAITAKIGNVVSSTEIDGVLFTLAADAVVRSNDLDLGLLVGRTNYPAQAQAEAGYAVMIAKARRVADDFLWDSGFDDMEGGN
tara:strand:- start:9651 stop:9917 length:267 start_codon:yes stop_codon:yes gene_type:complete